MPFWMYVGNRILLDRPLPFKLHQSYRPLLCLIREFNPSMQEIWLGPAAGMQTSTLLSEDGPQEDFAAVVEWTLPRNGSPLTICLMDDLARSTPDPVPSPPSPRCVERMPEPPRLTSRRCTERQSHGSLPSSVGTHSWAQPWNPGGSQIPALPPTHTLTLSPPSMQGFSIPGHRDPPRSAYFAWNWGLEDWNWERLIYAVQALRDCHPPASPWSEFPSTLPPRPVDPSAPPWPLAPSSPP